MRCVSPRASWTVGAITVAGALLRLPAFLESGLWRDDANVYVQVTAPTFREFVVRLIGAEWHPPLYFLLAYGWARIAGTSEITLKIIPFGLGIATVPLVYLLGKQVSSRGTGLIAASLYAVSPLALEFSSEYVYPLAGFLCTLLAILVAETRTRVITPKQWAALALATALLFYTHYIALLYVPLLALWGLLSTRSARQRLLLGSALTAGALAFLGWLPVFLAQMHVGIPYRAAMPATAREGLFFTSAMEAMPVPTLLAEFAFFMFFAALILPGRVRVGSGPTAFALIFLFLLAVEIAADLLATRYIFPLYGLMCVFLGAVLDEVSSRIAASGPAAMRRYAYFAAALAILLLASDGRYAVALSAPKSGIRALASGGLRADTLYYVAPDYVGSTFAYYARGTGVTVHGFVRERHPEIFRVAGYQKVWNCPDVVDESLSAIAAEQSHYAYLSLIVDPSAQRIRQMPYDKTWQLLAALLHRYKPVAATAYPARYESVTEYRFRLQDDPK
jgi:4-amino-4-deoxy-L-arabinose transferase-like glycosyltransferase